MNRLALLFLLGLVAGVAQAAETPPPFHRYRDLIDDLSLTAPCKSALHKFYKKGRDLHSEQISQQLIPLKSWNEHFKDLTSESRVPIQGFKFFHYTNFDLGQFLHTEIPDREKAESAIRTNFGYEKIILNSQSIHQSKFELEP